MSIIICNLLLWWKLLERRLFFQCHLTVNVNLSQTSTWEGCQSCRWTFRSLHDVVLFCLIIFVVSSSVHTFVNILMREGVPLCLCARGRRWWDSCAGCLVNDRMDISGVLSIAAVLRFSIGVYGEVSYGNAVFCFIDIRVPSQLTNSQSSCDSAWKNDEELLTWSCGFSWQ